ncbi:hypothetical protein SCALM49S_03750 [Streptomyces californicus]
MPEGTSAAPTRASACTGACCRCSPTGSKARPGPRSESCSAPRRLPRGPQILLQSRTEPDPSRLPAAYGSVETRSLDALLSHLCKGMVVNYRCVANPVRKPGEASRKAYGLPPVVALSGNAAVEWWERQARAGGLEPLHVDADPLTAVRGNQGPQGPAAKRVIQQARVRFDGAARVLDAELLRERLASGIGRGKAYGCGLLTLAPAR